MFERGGRRHELHEEPGEPAGELRGGLDEAEVGHGTGHEAQNREHRDDGDGRCVLFEEEAPIARLQRRLARRRADAAPAHSGALRVHDRQEPPSSPDASGESMPYTEAVVVASNVSGQPTQQTAPSDKPTT